jgi:acyl-CoA synthetase (NDP forming)
VTVDRRPLPSRVRATVRIARSEGRTVLLEHEALEVVQGLLGLAVPHHLVAEDVDALASLDLDEFSGPRVAVKALSPDLVHKSRVGAVAMVPRRADAVTEAARAMAERLDGTAEPAGFLVEEFVEHRAGPGGELLLGIRGSREFGPVVTLGLGGSGVETLAALLPRGEATATFGADADDPEDIRAQLGDRALIRLASGEVGSAATAPSRTRLAMVVEEALAFARRAVPLPFREVEVNPLVFTSRGPMALDAVVHLATETGAHGPAGADHAGAPPDLDAILAPRSVAVVGVSTRINPGRVILRNLVAAGFPRDRITVVKPDHPEPLEGCVTVPDLSELDEPVDLLVVAVPAAAVPALLDRVAREGRARGVILIPGGLGEGGGDDGARRRMEARVRRLRDRGIRVNGGNCLGVRSVPARVDTLFIPADRLPRPSETPAPLALLSQSGAFAVARMSRLAGPGPRHVITVGNQVDVTLGEWLEYLLRDRELRVVGCYVEGFREGDGRRFLRAARAATRSGRTVVLYRAGRTPAGADAMASHTASVAGDYTVTRELAARAGILVADTVEEFDTLVELALVLDPRPLPGLGLGAVSNAGFEAVAVADAAGPLELPVLATPTRRALERLVEREGLGAVVEPRNPLDVTPVLDDAALVEAVRLVMADPGVHLGLVGCVPLTPALSTLPEEPQAGGAPPAGGAPGLARRLGDLWRETDTPWVAVVDAGPLYDSFVRSLESRGVPVLPRADAAVRTLGRYAAWRHHLGRS